MTKWKIGDIIESMTSPGIFREILEVRESGYSWRYPDLNPEIDKHENYFISENGNDPDLQNWKPAPAHHAQQLREAAKSQREYAEMNSKTGYPMLAEIQESQADALDAKAAEIEQTLAPR